jgi:carboxyl-terminal processing protease
MSPSAERSTVQGVTSGMRLVPRQRRVLVSLAVAIAFGGCFLDGSTAPDPRDVTRAFLRDLVDIMEFNSVRRDSIDWVAFRADVYAEGAMATTYDQTYPAIQLALQRLEDNHSWFQIPSGGYLTYPRTIDCTGSLVPTPTGLPADIGYVRISSFGGSDAQADAYMTAIQAQMESVDSDALVGWVIDLRGNGGGNMWPMLAALHPFLDGSTGFFVDPDSLWNEWWVYDGTSFLDQFPISTVPTPFVPRATDGRVAVLTDVRVASSGEATAVAFRGRPNTRSFGTATCGVSTGIVAGPVGPGFTLGLATVWMADRDSTRYGGKLPPDELITDPDATLARAIEWIRSGI